MNLRHAAALTLVGKAAKILREATDKEDDHEWLRCAAVANATA
jgi:hypothetical protein